MKKSIFLLNDLQRISRDELRKIGGGSTPGCSGCDSVFVGSISGGLCAFRGPNGEVCFGTVVRGQCCV